MPTQIESVEKLAELVGQEVALSEWLEVSQERIDAFAEATEDRQWIHTDPERAARESPFKETIAHGFLTLSLLSELMKLGVSVRGVRMGINYGLNRVRFVAPGRAGARVRDRVTLLEAQGKGPGRVLLTARHTIEIEGESKPALVADLLAMLIG